VADGGAPTPGRAGHAHECHTDCHQNADHDQNADSYQYPKTGETNPHAHAYTYADANTKIKR